MDIIHLFVVFFLIFVDLTLFGSFTDKATQNPDLFTPFLHEFISSPEPKALQPLQTSSLKPLDQLNSNFIWRLLRTRKQKFVQMVLVR